MKVFISYASEDSESAQSLYQWLKNEKRFEPWIDRENLLAGSDWEFEILTNIKSAKAIILLISKHSLNKVGYVQKEIKEALKKFEFFPPGEVFLIPVRIDNVEPKYHELDKLHRIDLFKGWENGVAQISSALDRIQPPISVPQKLPSCTYQVWEDASGSIVNELYQYGETAVPSELTFSLESSLFVIRAYRKSALAYKQENKFIRIVRGKFDGVNLLNAEQVFFAWLLIESRFKIILLFALSGTGKTLLISNYLTTIVKRRRIYVVGNTVQARKVWEQFNKAMEAMGRPVKEDHVFRILEHSDLSLYDMNYATIVGCFDNSLTTSELKQMLVQLQDSSQCILLTKFDFKAPNQWASYLHNKLCGTEFYHHAVLNRIQRSEISTELNELL